MEITLTAYLEKDTYSSMGYLICEAFFIYCVHEAPLLWRAEQKHSTADALLGQSFSYPDNWDVACVLHKLQLRPKAPPLYIMYISRKLL